MKYTRIKPTALAALVLALAMILTSCGVIGDYVISSTFAINRLSVDAEGETTDTEAASDTVTEPVEDTKDSESPDDENGGAGHDVVIHPPEAQGEPSTPLMWHVVDPKTGGELWLLGSMHAGLSDMCLFPNEIYAAFDACPVLAVETDVIELEKGAAMGVEGMRMLVYQDGTKISDHVPADVYEQASQILGEAGYPQSFMDYYMPILWQQVIEEILTEQTHYKYENGVDRYFLNEAKRIGKEDAEVENPLDTYKRLAALSERTQLILLEDEIDPEYVGTFAEGIASLYEMWKRGDLAEIEEALTEDDIEPSEPAETTDADTSENADADTAPNADADTAQNADADTEPNADDDTEPNADADTAQDADAPGTKDAPAADSRSAAYREYNNAMLVDRNVGMISKARELLNGGRKVFYVVGLAHMIGDDGIVAGLEALGYKVELVAYENRD